MSSILRGLVLACVSLVCLVSSAQQAQLTGHVTDPQRAAVTGARVAAINQDTMAKLDTLTGADGTFQIPLIPPGRYRVVVEADGFNSAVSSDLRIQAGKVVVFDMQLSVKSAVTQVTVQGGGATQIELETPELSGTITEKEVTSYGLNGRIATQLIALTPGVSNQTGQDEGKTGVAGSAKYSVNGGRVQYNIFEVDGADVLNNSINAARGGNTFVVNPSVDAIAEIKVLTSSYGAMYGKTSSGIVQISTKSGTDKYHGSGYEFLRNEMFNARNYFDNTAKGAPLYRRQDFGGTIGGPLTIPGVYKNAKNKTHFFFSEEARMEKTPVQYNQAVPSLAERAGDFSDVCPPSSDLDMGMEITAKIKAKYPDCPVMRTDGTNGEFFLSTYPRGGVSNIVPIDPISRAFLGTGLLPTPNSVSGCNSTVSSSSNPACYVETVSPSTSWREELFRIDHQLTPSQLLTFRYIHDTWDTTVLTPQWGMVLNSFPTVQNHIDGPGTSMVASLSGMLGESIMSHVSFSYVAEHITLTGFGGEGATIERSSVPLLDSSTSGIGSFFNNGYGGKLPGMLFKGNNVEYGEHGFNIDTGYTPWQTVNPTYTLSADFSKTLDKHLLQFGVQATVAQQNEEGAANGLNSGDVQGEMSFNMQGANGTALGSNSGSCYNCYASTDTGNVFANFLGAQMASYQQDSSQNKYYNRYNAAEPYIQDTWKVTPRLTISLGFRAGLFGTWYNAKGTAYNWVPSVYDQSINTSVTVDKTYGFLERAGGTGAVRAVSLDGWKTGNVDPAITSGLVRCGSNGVPKSCMSSHIFNPMPRIGFVWDVFGDGKTAIHAGYGIFYEHGTSYEANAGSLAGSAPLTLSESALSPKSYQCAGGYSSGTSCTGSSPLVNGSVAYPINVTSLPLKATYPNTQQWSLSVQQEMKFHIVTTAAYVGAKGTHLTAVRDLNQILPVNSSLNPYRKGQPINSTTDCAQQNESFPVGGNFPVSSGQAAFVNMEIACYGTAAFGTPVNHTPASSSNPVNPTSLRPYKTMGDIMSVANIADSNYHALQFSLRRTAAPLVLGVAYTYSHSIDDSSDRSDANFTNSYNQSSSKASSSFDERHMLNISYIYDLPLMRLWRNFASAISRDPDTDTHAEDYRHPSDFGLSRVARQLLDHWQLSGITIYQTGTPFSIVNGGSSGGISVADNAGVANYYGTGSYVDCVSHPGRFNTSASSTNTVGPLLGNPAAYAAPQGLSFGNCGRNSANNPSRTNFNMAVLKTLAVKQFNIELRAEAFNVFNHTQFRIYDPAHAGSTGNNIIGCYDTGNDYTAAGSSCLAGNSFLHPVDAHDPRILQFGMKMSF